MQTDFLVIGSGISGLNFALNAAKKGQVLIVTKKKIIDSNTNYAQGGIAAVLDKTDNIESHIKDTLEAGAFHNKKSAVRFMVKNSTESIYKLMELGVPFEQEKGKLKLTKEGGHNTRRIAYIGDYTGKEIEKTLVKRVKENPNIKIFENTFAVTLIVKNKTCYGAQILQKNKIENIYASQTILATGGIGQVFENTTNPSIATGDGIAIGFEAGCKIKDMEFIQFHPTTLAKKTSPRFLLSEALRGEGAKLINHQKKAFIKNSHKELATRDIVAREIYQELKNGPVYLDITHKKTDYLKTRFPKIYQHLKKYGYDLAKDKIPITPAVHYICGGIITNLKGQTNIKNLFAFGEVTCTGVHGANRLASNSLLEALVFSNQIISQLKNQKQKHLPQLKIPVFNRLNSKETTLAKKLKKEIQTLMWKYAGIVRDLKEIKNIALPQIQNIKKQLAKIHDINQEIIETKNIATVSELILKAALKRKISLGCHFVK